MPKVVVFSFDDLGTNFRLLRHAKSFADQPDTQVYLIGNCNSILPSDIENHPNIKIRQNPHGNTSLLSMNILIIPILFIVRLVTIISLFTNLGSVDIIVTSTSRIIFNIVIAKILQRIKKSKLVFDIRPFKSVNKNSSRIFMKIETGIPSYADICIVPTRSIQGFLQIKKIPSIIIRDNPGTLFQPSMEYRNDINTLLGIKKETGLIGIPITEESQASEVVDIATRSDSLNVPLCFCAFGGGKNQAQLEHSLNNLKLKNVKVVVLPMLSDAYPRVLGACDLGICFNGARAILDLSPELVEMEWACIPVAVMLRGCVKEAISESTGFFFKTPEELFAIVKNVFVDKSVDLNAMREECKTRLVPWDKSWKEAFHPILEQTHLKAD